MTVAQAHPATTAAHRAAPSRAPGPADLAELLAAFNEVTARLQGTHERLQREVAALKAELSEANEALARSRRLAALGEMAAGIAHEVRNPLSSIALYARLLEQDLPDRPEQRATAGRIAAAVHGLNAVVGDVLDFAREFRVRAARVTAGDLFTRALEACGHEGPGVRVVRRDLQGPPVQLDADPVLAHTALANVLRNAFQAMADHPRSRGHTLELDARAASSPDGSDARVLRVADSGPGVSRDLVDRMFNPFFTTRAAGTGLGLAIVHRIVDAHGGRVSVANRDGGGAVFELCFPFPAQRDPAATDRAGPPAPGRDPVGRAGGRT